MTEGEQKKFADRSLILGRFQTATFEVLVDLLHHQLKGDGSQLRVRHKLIRNIFVSVHARYNCGLPLGLVLSLTITSVSVELFQIGVSTPPVLNGR